MEKACQLVYGMCTVVLPVNHRGIVTKQVSWAWAAIKAAIIALK